MLEGSYWGKVMGAGVGFMLGGPVGAMFGAFAGHGLDRMKDRGLFDRWLPPPEPQISFTAGLVTLAVKMAQADGGLGRREAEAFGRVFHAPGCQAAELRRLFAQAESDRRGIEPYAGMLAETFADTPGLLEELLEALIIVGLADGPLNASELAFLRQVAGIFGFDEPGFQRVLVRHQSSERADPYQVLGVSPEAADEDVKLAWRNLIRATHPDTLVAQGLPAEMIEIATRRMAAINGAWDRVKKERGL
jgi:DnaJ like chaperone protein